MSAGGFEVRGRQFASVPEAAKAFGVSREAVYYALRHKRLHRLGLRHKGAEPMPVMIRGKRYENAHKAAAAHGVGVSAVYQALSKGRIDRLGLPRGTPSCGRVVPVQIGPMSFPSLRALSLALGRNPGYASCLMRRQPDTARQTLLGAVMALHATIKKTSSSNGFSESEKRHADRCP